MWLLDTQMTAIDTEYELLKAKKAEGLIWGLAFNGFYYWLLLIKATLAIPAHNQPNSASIKWTI